MPHLPISYYQGTDSRYSRQVNADAVTQSYQGVSQFYDGISTFGSELQKGIDKVLNETKDIEDLGNLSKYHLQLQDINARLAQRIAAAPNDYDAHITYAGEAVKQISSLDYTFHDPKQRIRFEADRDTQARMALYNTVAGVQKGRLQNAQASFQADYQHLVSLGNWDGANQLLIDATGPILNPSQAALERYQLRQQQLHSQASKLLATDPGQFFDALDRGDFSELDAASFAKYQRAMEKDLEQYHQPITFTAAEKAAAASGQLVKPRYKIRNGATEQEHEWYNHKQKFGNLRKYDDQIAAAYMDELRNAPAPESKQEAAKWVEAIVKKYSDPETGYEVDPNTIRLLAEDKMNGMLQVEAASRNVDVMEMTRQIPIEQLMPGLDKRIKKTDNGWYLSSSRREKATKGIYDESWNRREKIGQAASVKMAEWRKTHPNATYDQQINQAGIFIAQASQEIDKKSTKTAADFSSGWKDLLSGTDLRDKGALGDKQDQNLKHREHLQTTPAHRNTDVTLPPVEMRVAPIPGNEPGVYIHERHYEALKQKLGENLNASVTLPNKANASVPILGTYDGPDQGIRMTTATRKNLASLSPDRAAVRFSRGEGEAKPLKRLTSGPDSPITGEPTTSLNTIRQHAKSSLAIYADDFIRIGQQEGVDPALLLAIALHETGNGTSSALRTKNNAMGISPNGGGPRSFASVQESITYAARLLKKHYIDQGRTSIAAIGAKYAPPGAKNDPGNLNSHWTKRVLANYKAIKQTA